MGVLNLTPDSFSDGGNFLDFSLATHQIKAMIAEGAAMIDVGGESTGPGSSDVSAEEELERVKPIIDFIHKTYHGSPEILFSIDTYKSSVAEHALQQGFHIVNDVTALRGDPRMMDVLLKYKPYVILMYSKDPTARTTRDPLAYDDVVATIRQFLTERVNQLLRAGFPKEKIILDPGMGTFISAIPDYSFEIIQRLPELCELGYPVMIGISRKSCLGGVLEDRDPSSVEWSMKAIRNGASMVRIHNVQLMKQALIANNL